MWPSPRKLYGSRVTLLPLCHAHSAQLAQATQSGPHIPEGCSLPVRHDMQGEISYLLERQAEGLAVTYAIQCSQARLRGCVSFINIDRGHKKLEIGNLWLASECAEVFEETMTLLMSHAFDTARANTVQLRCLATNTAHRQRLEALGASLDGVLRGERIARNGTLQDVAAYSILKSEWPDKGRQLLTRLA